MKYCFCTKWMTLYGDKDLIKFFQHDVLFVMKTEEHMCIHEYITTQSNNATTSTWLCLSPYDVIYFTCMCYCKIGRTKTSLQDDSYQMTKEMIMQLISFCILICVNGNLMIIQHLKIEFLLHSFLFICIYYVFANANKFTYTYKYITLLDVKKWK